MCFLRKGCVCSEVQQTPEPIKLKLASHNLEPFPLCSSGTLPTPPPPSPKPIKMRRYLVLFLQGLAEWLACQFEIQLMANNGSPPVPRGIATEIPYRRVKIAGIFGISHFWVQVLVVPRTCWVSWASGVYVFWDYSLTCKIEIHPSWGCWEDRGRGQTFCSEYRNWPIDWRLWGAPWSSPLTIPPH